MYHYAIFKLEPEGYPRDNQGTRPDTNFPNLIPKFPRDF